MAAGVDLDGLVLRRHAAVLVGDDGLLQLLPPARPALRRHRRPREVRQQLGLDRQRRREGGAGNMCLNSDSRWIVCQPAHELFGSFSYFS